MKNIIILLLLIVISLIKAQNTKLDTRYFKLIKLNAEQSIREDKLEVELKILILKYETAIAPKSKHTYGDTGWLYQYLLSEQL